MTLKLLHALYHGGDEKRCRNSPECLVCVARTVLRVVRLRREYEETKTEWRMELALRNGEKGNPCTPRRKHT